MAPDNPNIIDTTAKRGPKPTWSSDQLLTARQASKLLSSFVTTSFSTNGPAGYEFQGKPLFTAEQLLDWLSAAVANQRRAVRPAAAQISFARELQKFSPRDRDDGENKSDDIEDDDLIDLDDDEDEDDDNE